MLIHTLLFKSKILLNCWTGLVLNVFSGIELSPITALLPTLVSSITLNLENWNNKIYKKLIIIIFCPSIIWTFKSLISSYHCIQASSPSVNVDDFFKDMNMLCHNPETTNIIRITCLIEFYHIKILNQCFLLESFVFNIDTRDTVIYKCFIVYGVFSFLHWTCTLLVAYENIEIILM